MPLIFSTGRRASSPQGLHHETSLEATAGALARALARGRVHFLLASVLQHAIIIERGRLTLAVEYPAIG